MDYGLLIEAMQLREAAAAAAAQAAPS